MPGQINPQTLPMQLTPHTTGRPSAVDAHALHCGNHVLEAAELLRCSVHDKVHPYRI